ncbi:unnamed protein product [Urochloa decumbens]|uniref:SIAH-type domain-containing protein n=2 Tax=Urochloa decumbens TaxID=240449 RepID=A0ABC8YWZ1_9POAL
MHPGESKMRTNRKTARKAAAPVAPRKKKNAFMNRDKEGHGNKIWIDPDALSVECAICFTPFEAEVFMCKNGHAACAKCCVRINRKCWCCGKPIGDMRCRPLENVLAEMNTHCRFSKYGCTEVVKYIDKSRHEEACPRAPSGCPVDGCTYRGLLLYKHLLDEHSDAVVFVANNLPATTTTLLSLHKSAPFRVLVLERATDAGEGEGSVFLLLNGGGVLSGRSLSLVRLGAGDVEFGYKMEVRGSEPGVLSLERTAPRVRELEGFEAKMFLFVPDASWAPTDRVSVSIRIG